MRNPALPYMMPTPVSPNLFPSHEPGSDGWPQHQAIGGISGRFQPQADLGDLTTPKPNLVPASINSAPPNPSIILLGNFSPISIGSRSRSWIRRQRVWSCTSARKPPRPCRRSCPRIQPSWTPPARVFELSASQIGRRIDAAAKAAGLGEGFTGHLGRVGMAQDLAASGVELPELMTAGRWKSSRMPARYTERQTAGRGAVARYYQGRGGLGAASQE